METTKIIAGLDTGNGYMKGSARLMTSGTETAIDIPSCVAYVTNANDIKVKPEEVANTIDDIFNNMDVSFTSPLVKDMNRRLFGKRGIMSGMTLEEFDVYSHVSKANQDLSGILILGTMAGAALKDYYALNGALPDEMIDVTVRIALALPIREFKKYRVQYAGRLKAESHIVTFHNFEKQVRVNITFEDVQVLAEGASAQYAIMAKGANFVNALLTDCRRFTPLEGITAEDVIAAATTVGIDIGEGTTNFPVFQNGSFNTDVSITFDKGYGSILVKALDRLQDAGFAFDSRKALADYLQTQPSAIKRAAYNKVKAIVEEETVAFVNEVKMQFVKIMSRVGAYVEVVYVYGGGATPVQGQLHPELVDVARNFSTEFPILYLDSRYSRYLNREGLYFIADQVARSQGVIA